MEINKYTKIGGNCVKVWNLHGNDIPARQSVLNDSSVSQCMKRAHYIPMLLSGENPLQEKKGKATSYTDIQYPDGCQVNFDFRLIDLFNEMRKHDPLQKRMKDEFYRLKAELDRRPTRVDIFEGCDIELTHFL